jgi:hypothetical protein
VSLRQIAIAWFLNQYLVDKEEEESNAHYGGYGAMAKASDFESLNIRETAPLTYSFDFEQLVAGRTDLMTRLPTRATSSPTTRTFTLTVGLPTNAEMARDGFANGTCPTSIVCMPMTKVWASAARIRTVVASRPAWGLRRAK